MRVAGRSLILALLAAAGCNQIFGIGQTQAWDAHAPFDAPDWTTSITWQTLQDTGQVATDPIDGLTVQLAALDGTSALMPAAVDSEGNFNVPYALAFAPYRVVFAAPDGIPTEIQTKLQGFRYAFPIYGRHARETVTAGATFSGTVTGTVTADAARLLTTGLWSVTELASGAAAFSFPYQASAVSLSGPLGVPRGSDGDTEVVVYTNAGAPAGFAVFSAAGLGAAGSAAIQTPATTTVMWTEGTSTTAGSRLSAALGGNLDVTATGQVRTVGAIPTTTMPSFVQPLTAASASAASAPPAVLLPLDETSLSPAELMNPFAAGTNAPTLPLAVYAGDFRTRHVTGPPQTYLTSALQSITPVMAGGMVALDDPVGIAMSAMLAGTPLVSDASSVAIAGATQLPLTFVADGKVDDCAVVLFRVENGSGSLTPIARYIVTDTPGHAQVPILVDASFLDPSSTFTFGIHCEAGHDLSANDFTQVTYPFSASTTFTATFTAH